MFGYVKPVHTEILVKEYEFYKATYCGVCRAMKKYTGYGSNVMHSYDSVFLALVRMLFIPDEKIRARRGRCIAHPIKSRGMLCDNEAIEYTARAFGILTYYKLCDDIMDEKIMRRLAVRMLKPIFSRAKKKAALKELSSLVCDKLSLINGLEKEKCKSVDEPAKLFGEILGEIFSAGLLGSDKTVCYAVGFYLGKFIYAADAAEDYEKDRASGKYNPYVLLYDGAELTYENRQSIKCALLLECRQLEGAINLLPFGNLLTIENIIKNIIYLGLPKRISFLDSEKDNSDKREEERK